MAIDKKHYTGGNTEGGITSSYATDDGVKLKVPYSFMGSIYDEAEELKTEYESRLSSAKTEAEDIVKSATRNAALKSEEIISDAHSRAQEIIERADKQIEAERRNAENELKNEVSDIALTIASKVIESELDEEKHKKLIDSFIAEMGDAK